MKEYKVVAILWDDHTEFDRTELIKNPESVLKPTLTIGFIYKKTPKTITVVSDLEAYTDRTNASYIVILRSAIKSIKEYGSIQLSI